MIDTARLGLREMTLDDLDFIADLLADPEVMQFYPKCHSRDEARQWVAQQIERYERDGFGLWLVVSREDELPVGQVGLALREVDGVNEPEIGYLIHRPYWRQGFATEAALAVRDYAFDERGMERVISLIRPINIPSQGVAKKLGMRPERLTDYRDLRHIVFSVTREWGS